MFILITNITKWIIKLHKMRNNSLLQQEAQLGKSHQTNKQTHKDKQK